MPFSPFHFGVNGIVGWPLKRWVDWPVLVLASAVVDIEPLMVMYYKFDVPIHWICHTFLVGALVGVVWGLIAYPIRPFFKFGMWLLRLPYETGLKQMVAGGIFGVWLHVFVDAFLYREMNPFWPINGNPFYRLLSCGTIWFICDLCLVGGIIVYVSWLVYFRRKANRLDKIHRMG
jgi:membrane-bound metal-dependent hydrolase YbcI (DUF457 family)